MNGHRQALTLTEVLATVAVFALLAALLAPALADVNARGKGAVCLQNLARIAQASIVYAAADENEQAVPVHPQVYNPAIDASLRRTLPAHCWGGKSGRGHEDGDSLFWGTGRSKGPVTRPLNRILYGDVFPDYRYNPGPGFINWKKDGQLDLPLYRCPADRGYRGIHWTSWRDSGLTSYDHYGNSYAAGVLWVYFAGPSSLCMSNAPFLHRLSDIVNPAQTVYYLENCGRYAFQANPQPPDCGGGQEGVVRGWHGRDWIFNVAFVDGRVEPVKIKGFQNPHLGHYPVQDYSHWKCLIVRGDNWQLDTLPLAPVYTTIPCDRREDDPAQGCGDRDIERARIRIPEIG